MKIAALFDDRAWGQQQQDMLLDALASGLVDSFGSTNVRFFPPTKPQFLGAPAYATTWPFWLGFGCLQGKPLATFPLDKADAYLINVRWPLESVRDGLQTEAEQREMLKQIDPAKTVLIDSSDSPSFGRMHDASLCLNTEPIYYCHRPNPEKGTWKGSAINRMQVHIGVPLQHIARMLANRDTYPCNEISVHCALSDNSQLRRDVMDALMGSDLPNTRLRWGSGSGHEIKGSSDPVAPPYYYAELSKSRVAVSCRGGSVDCLRQSEILACGALLVTDGDSGWIGDDGKPSLKHGGNCLMYDAPQTCINECRWAIEHQQEAAEIARAGQRLYFDSESPAHVAEKMIRKSRLE